MYRIHVVNCDSSYMHNESILHKLSDSLVLPFLGQSILSCPIGVVFRPRRIGSILIGAPKTRITTIYHMLDVEAFCCMAIEKVHIYLTNIIIQCIMGGSPGDVSEEPVT